MEINERIFKNPQEAALREGRQFGSRPTGSGGGGGVLVVGGGTSGSGREGELNTAANCDFRSGEGVNLCAWDNLVNTTVLRSLVTRQYSDPKVRDVQNCNEILHMFVIILQYSDSIGF